MISPLRLCAGAVALCALAACADSPSDTKPDASVDVDDSGTAPALCSRYPDDDGDGHGAATAVEVDCDAPGFVSTGDDCDDTSAEVYPGAPERCNEVDDDCDGTLDEDLSYDWYADADADGFGAGDSIDDCDPPDGFVANAGDCDDSNPGVHPDAAEVCNTLDDDCDSLVDDEDPSVDLATGTTWHLDDDGDGFGNPSTTTLACSQPEGHARSGDDCDDANDAVHPDATEVCNELDDNCDGDVDDADAALDTSTGTPWYADDDGDGYGDATRERYACAVPSGYASAPTDCDDTDSAVHPDATEVCNDVDDDCDGATDDDDPDVDTTTGQPTYADTDGDGFGDPATEVYACDVASGRTGDDTDCDDTDGAVFPGATEVCNEVDDDCDGDTDDDDLSLDLSTADTWYLDSDGDGDGDASSTLVACAQPSGYVATGGDCDDSGFSDLDGDLLQDCEDDDADGDGLSSTYDVDDFDDSLVRGPTGGFGTDGALSSSGGTWSGSSEATTLTASAATGDSTLTVADSSLFSVGDEVLVWTVQGDDAGVYAFHFVTGVATGSLTVEPLLTEDFDSADAVVIQRVPHHTTVSVSGTLSPAAWDGATGGLLVLRATGAVGVSGAVDASGLGYLGGDGTASHFYSPTSGGTWSEGPAPSTTFASAVDGGGGARTTSANSLASGGGGAYGTDGDPGDWKNGVLSLSGGASYGDAALSDWFFGSGGGGGSADSEVDGIAAFNVSGAGGAGGGLVALYSADSITISGEVLANGTDGVDAEHQPGVSNYGEIGGGGGGAGGQVLLVAPSVTLSLTATVEALGGSGGSGASDETTAVGEGGGGGDGRIRIESTSSTRTSLADPTPSTGAYAD